MDYDPWKQDKDWTPPDGADNGQVPPTDPVAPPPTQPEQAPETAQPQQMDAGSPYSVPPTEGSPYQPPYQPHYQPPQTPQPPYQQNNYQSYQQPYQPYNSNPYGQPVPEAPVTEPGKGVGIASMVLGILSVTLCCLFPYFTALPGLICAIISMAKGYRKAFSIVGLILSILGIILCIVWIVYAALYSQDPYFYYNFQTY
jgi:hypothetical protein